MLEMANVSNFYNGHARLTASYFGLLKIILFLFFTASLSGMSHDSFLEQGLKKRQTDFCTLHRV